MAARVTVVTAGHLATCPRMLKAADALHEAGYDVRVISTRHTGWAAAADRRLHARRAWRWQCVPYDRTSAPLTWARTGVRFRLMQALARRAAPMPAALAPAAYSRIHAELVAAILRERQDFIYGGTSGSLAAVAEASRRSGTPCAVDFEDFHCGEHPPDAHGSARNDLAAIVMARAVQRASFVTAGSAAIAQACRERFDVVPIVINNVFPLPECPSVRTGGGPLRLYWFSQTIGPGRGLEDVIRAVGRAGIPAELHLRGSSIPAYAEALDALSRTVAPRLRTVCYEPDDPDSMVSACRGFDVGLAVEPGHTLNSALLLSNKALTYPLAGLAIALTDTPGQRVLAKDLGVHALSYAPGRIDDLADGLSRWHEDRGALRRASEAAWNAARNRWRWDHPLERDALVAAVRAVA